MELRLEIKLASVEELSIIAKALTGLQVSEVAPKEAKRAATTVKVVEEVTETEDEMIEVESPYAPSEPTPGATPAKPKPASNKATAAEAKAAKKAQEDADRADRVQRLKDQMELSKGPATQALATRAENLQANAQDNYPKVEPVESIVEEIKQLGDRLMSYQGVALEAKQQLTAQVMAKVGVPTGVRPTQLQQPMLGQFRDMYKAAVEGATNPVMGGLV